MAIKTNRTDVVATFVRYYGRQPGSGDSATIDYLTTKAPTEVEALLAKNSPVTSGKLWSEYQSNKTTTPTRTTPTAQTTASVKTTPTTQTTQTTTPTQNIKTNKNDVVATFVRYYGRQPKASDNATIDYLTTKNPSEVEALLAENSPITNGQLWSTYQSTKTGASTAKSTNANDTTAVANEEEKARAEWKAWLDDLKSSGTIDDAEYAALSDIMADEKYTSGQKILTRDELKKLSDEALTKATADVADYYKKTESQDIEDLRNKYADIRNESARYSQQESKSYAETLSNAKASLRAKGLTFSGTSRGSLGAETAVKEGNLGIEGELPQQRRYDYEDKMAALQEAARDTGTEAERKYGSAWLSSNASTLNPDGLVNPYASGSTTYTAGRTQTLYAPKKDSSELGYTQYGSVDSEKAAAIQARKLARLKAIKPY